MLGHRGPRHAWAVRGVFRHNLRNYYDTFRLPSMSDQQVSELVQLAGLEHLQGGAGRRERAPSWSRRTSAAWSSARRPRPGGARRHRRGRAGRAARAARPDAAGARESRPRAVTSVGPSLAVELAAALRPQRARIPRRRPRRRRAPASRSSSSDGRPACRPGPALLSLRTGAPILPGLRQPAPRRPAGRRGRRAAGSPANGRPSRRCCRNNTSRDSSAWSTISPDTPSSGPFCSGCGTGTARRPRGAASDEGARQPRRPGPVTGREREVVVKIALVSPYDYPYPGRRDRARPQPGRGVLARGHEVHVIAPSRPTPASLPDQTDRASGRAGRCRSRPTARSRGSRCRCAATSRSSSCCRIRASTSSTCTSR